MLSLAHEDGMMTYTDNDLERIAEKAADKAANKTANKSPSMREIEEVVERIAKEATERAVATAVPLAISQTLAGFGLDPADKKDVLRDFMFLRDLRTLSSDSRKHTFLALIGAIITAVVGVVFAYAKGSGKL